MFRSSGMNGVTQRITAVWSRLQGELAVAGTRTAVGLRDGASNQDIEQFEQEVGVLLPDALRASYAIHDGQHSDSDDLFPPWRLLSLDDALTTSRRHNALLESGDFPADTSPSPNQKPWWNRLWIPITANGLGDHHV